MCSQGLSKTTKANPNQSAGFGNLLNKSYQPQPSAPWRLVWRQTINGLDRDVFDFAIAASRVPFSWHRYQFAEVAYRKQRRFVPKSGCQRGKHKNNGEKGRACLEGKVFWQDVTGCCWISGMLYIHTCMYIYIYMHMIMLCGNHTTSWFVWWDVLIMLGEWCQSHGWVAQVSCHSLYPLHVTVREMLPKKGWFDRICVGSKRTPGLRGIQAGKLRSMASTWTEERCIKLREALQYLSKLALRIDIAIDYENCRSHPTTSEKEITCDILQESSSKFEAACCFDVWIPLGVVSGFEYVAIKCSECLVWKPLQASCRDASGHPFPDRFYDAAKHLVWLLEDSNHEEPLFADAEANPLRIWEIFVAAKVQRQRFCTLAIYENFEKFTCGQNLVESWRTTRLWDKMVLRFKNAEFYLQQQQMIEENLQEQLRAFRQKLCNLRSLWARTLDPPFSTKLYCQSNCKGCHKGLSTQKIGASYRETLKEAQGRLCILTRKMSDLTTAASEIIKSLPVERPSEDAESSQGSALGSWLRPNESASQVGSSTSDTSYTLLSLESHCFLPFCLFKVSGQVEETSFISGKDTESENIMSLQHKK